MSDARDAESLCGREGVRQVQSSRARRRRRARTDLRSSIPSDSERPMYLAEERQGGDAVEGESATVSFATRRGTSRPTRRTRRRTERRVFRDREHVVRRLDLDDPVLVVAILSCSDAAVRGEDERGRLLRNAGAADQAREVGLHDVDEGKKLCVRRRREVREGEGR